MDKDKIILMTNYQVRLQSPKGQGFVIENKGSKDLVIEDGQNGQIALAWGEGVEMAVTDINGQPVWTVKRTQPDTRRS